MITIKQDHPKVLHTFFLTEMWERFGFYIVQTLLILFIIHHYQFSDERGYAILGAFTALAYIMPVFGGFVADKILGFKNTIILGNIFLIAGYGLLALPKDNFSILLLALALIVTGTGLFKPNISSYLGQFYKKDDPLREAGFTIFYIGINLGILLATASAGWVQQKFGWHVSFLMAAIGLVFGFFTFVIGMRNEKSDHHVSARLNVKPLLLRLLQKKLGLICILIFMIAAALGIIAASKVANMVLWVSSLILFMSLVYYSIRFEREVRNKFIALLFLIVAAIVFWAIFFQMFFSVSLFIDRIVNRNYFGTQIPTVMFICLESIFIFLLGPVFAKMWTLLSRRGINPSIAFKFGLATILAGIAFLWNIVGIHAAGASGMVDPIWIGLTFLFVTTGELLISPIGLSAVTTLAPANLQGLMMGVWFVSLGLGGKLAGVIADISSVPQNITDPKLVAPYYLHAFWQYVWFAFIAGAIIFLVTPVLRTMAKGHNPTWKAAFSWRKSH